MSEPRVVAIIQARLGATRLPGKVLLALGGMTVLALTVRRLQRARTLAAVVVVCLGAAILPISQVTRLEPALVFRG